MPSSQNKSQIIGKSVIIPQITSQSLTLVWTWCAYSQIHLINLEQSIPFWESGCVFHDMWTKHFHSSLSGVYNGSTLLIRWITRVASNTTPTKRCGTAHSQFKLGASERVNTQSSLHSFLVFLSIYVPRKHQIQCSAGGRMQKTLKKNILLLCDWRWFTIKANKNNFYFTLGFVNMSRI